RVLWRWVGAAVRPWLGWILLGAGALLMLLGYLGVSREALPAKQIPYLVSGGIGGMFLAVLGAYFLGTQELRNDSGRLDRLEGMVEDLHLALLRRPDAPDLTAVRAASANGNGSGNGSTNGSTTAPARKVVAVDGAELFHRPACDLVEGKDAVELTAAAARKRGLSPCPLCTPAPTSLQAG
ncbi:MAG: hypothetical protein ABL966_09085, partial [Acidimicrobiales bacterium]